MDNVLDGTVVGLIEGRFEGFFEGFPVFEVEIDLTLEALSKIYLDDFGTEYVLPEVRKYFGGMNPKTNGLTKSTMVGGIGEGIAVGK